jgi:hypothetical protein
MADLVEYKSLLEYRYEDAVEHLLRKYGEATDDYFKEKSYERLLKGEIKTTARGKISRTSEGLYCHHIDEYVEENLSNTKYVVENQSSFKYQKKERLVYCNLGEHLILHALISRETNGNFGFKGYMTEKDLIFDWYIKDDRRAPKPNWMKICREVGFLNVDDAQILLEITEKCLSQEKKFYDYFVYLRERKQFIDDVSQNGVSDIEDRYERLEDLKKMYAKIVEEW